MPERPKDWIKCRLCLGVIQYCDTPESINQIISEVERQGFEFQDFKITFSISIVAYINRILLISLAEETLKE